MTARALTLAALVALAGCAAQRPVGTDGLSFEERRARLEAVDAWAARGRLAVATAERGFQGSFEWRQAGEQLDLTVRGPLGGGVLRVSGRADDLTVTARGETHVLADPEAELSALLGWWLPVGSVGDWLLGMPDSAFRATVEPGSDGTLAGFDQREWRVDYPSYQRAGGDAGVLVPRRIDLAHGDLTLRVTIDGWRSELAAATP
jgi:outer membrane lipoprotein LolB